MDVPFPYDRYVTGKNFTGRRKDMLSLEALVVAGENVAIYGEPRTGKMSLVQQMLMHAYTQGHRFNVVNVDLLRERDTAGVLKAFVSSFLKACCNSSGEYADVIARYLDGTHFEFDEDRLSDYGEAVCFRGLPSELDFKKAFAMPGLIAADRNMRLVVLIEQFHTVLDCDKSYQMLSALEEVIQEHNPAVSYIFMGSQLNGMREIFNVKKWFWRNVELFNMSPVDTQDIVEYVKKGFQFRGKVIQPEFVESAITILRGNMWYINHLFSIIDGVARGFVGRDAVYEGIDILISIHKSRFYSMICSLTDFQLSFLKAVIDGETAMSSSKVISAYGLNSAANVKRVKDALIKKEILWFDDEDIPHIQDPLFEYWLRKVYFER